MNEIRSAADAIRRLDEMAAEFSGKKVDPSAEAKKKAAAYNAAFWDTMHTGMPQNGMKGGSDGSGGYLVPDTYEEDLVQALAEKNVIRKIAKTISTTRKLHSQKVSVFAPHRLLKITVRSPVTGMAMISARDRST